MLEHTLFVCEKPCPDVGQCEYCDGGLVYCTTCGAAESQLLDSCPGVQLTTEQHEWNLRGNQKRWKITARKRIQ